MNPFGDPRTEKEEMRKQLRRETSTGDRISVVILFLFALFLILASFAK